MANEATAEKHLCLYTFLPFEDTIGQVKFSRFSVKSDVTEEEVHTLSLRSSDCYPHEKMPLLGTGAFSFATCFVSMGSMIYCLGGSQITEQNIAQASNEVKKFDPSLMEFIPCCNMIQPRQFAGAVSSHGILYVFGGLPLDSTNPSPWAEYLDTTKPEIEQKWMPLNFPESSIFFPFAIPFNKAGTVLLIGCRRNIEVGAIIYDTTDMSFTKYDFVGLRSTGMVKNPVIVDRTMFWMDREFLIAYDMDEHIHHQAFMHLVLSEFDGFQTTRRGPLLVHLENNLFCFFTMYYTRGSDCEAIAVVECTKFLATKVPVPPQYEGWENLSLKPVGYQSYQCERMMMLNGVLPM